jgi:mannosyl-oligosaccharide alpha-1,2-mannosidase
LYRITGEKSLQDAAWRMFQNIERYTKTKYGYAALKDTRDIRTAKIDVMESFWLAETLKYFYLIFSDPNFISLDEYVL